MMETDMDTTKSLLKLQHFEIKGEKIVLVPFTDKHLHDPKYLNWLRDYDIMKYVGRPEYLNGDIPFSEVQGYVNSLQQSSNNSFFAIETLPEREFIGTFKIGNIDWHRKIADFGIAVGSRDWWGKGIATDVFEAALRFCFTKCEFHKITAGCSSANPAMSKVLEKVGFVEEGRFREQDLFEGKRYDHLHYGFLRQNYQNYSSTNLKSASFSSPPMPPNHAHRVSDKALEYLRQVVEDGFSQSSGPQMTNQFEKAFAKRMGAAFGIAHCNGTATLHSCLAAAGVKPGDEVITTPLTAAATSYAILHQGAIPVFADIDERTFNISPQSIRERITPLTKAILPVHLYGLPADMEAIMQIAKEHNLMVIEDSAQCFLGECNGKVSGTLGHLASFSFQSSKHLSCGDGGIVVTNSEELATKVRKFACFGYYTLTGAGGRIIPKKLRCDPQAVRHASMGWNYRMSNLQGAVALEQTERIDELVGKRLKIAEMLQEAIRGCPWLVPQYVPPGFKNSYWTFVCRFDESKAGCTWYQFRDKFYEFGGDLIYGGWRLTYNEPIFQERRFLGEAGNAFPIDSEIYKGKKQVYAPGLCPIAERIQPKLLQFKTNYQDLEFAKGQADALRKAVEFFGG